MKVAILLLSMVVGYGFVRLARVERVVTFIGCEAYARINGLSARPCVSHLKSPEQYLPDAFTITENP